MRYPAFSNEQARGDPVALAADIIAALATQIAGHEAHQRVLPIQPVRDRLQLAADLVPGKDLEYSGLDGTFLTHCRLRRRGLRFEFNGLHPQPTQNRLGTSPR
jgi:hypothetical protein